MTKSTLVPPWSLGIGYSSFFRHSALPEAFGIARGITQVRGPDATVGPVLGDGGAGAADSGPRRGRGGAGGRGAARLARPGRPARGAGAGPAGTAHQAAPGRVR